MISESQGILMECYGALIRRVLPDGEERLTYLGYPLRLSPDESRLLRILQTLDPQRADDQGYFAVDTVLDAMRAAAEEAYPLTDEERFTILFGHDYVCPSAPYSPEQIANVASRVNRKAKAIGGRPLILGRSHHGYRINPHM